MSAVLLAVGLFFSCRAARIYPSAMVQHWNGPNGDPGQDPSSFPKSRGTFQKSGQPLRPSGPPLIEAGNGDWTLSGGWKLQAVPVVKDEAAVLSKPDYDCAGWLDATVPGTVLTTMVDQGVYPDPLQGLNNLAIPEALCHQDYWYRNRFTLPVTMNGQSLTLTFAGINYAAEIWYDGQRLGKMKGAFRRGIFALPRQTGNDRSHVLLVRVSPPPHPGVPHEESLRAGPGPNGGSMCQDGPTFFCTEGWDWIPGIRDRCTGIWQDVVLHASGAVLLGDVQVKSRLAADLSSAELTLRVPVENHAPEARKLVLHGTFKGGSFRMPIELEAGARHVLELSPKEFPRLKIAKPRLWWPNGYGAPELYHLKLALHDELGKVTEEKSVRFGIRRVTYELSVLDARRRMIRIEYDPSLDGSQRLIDVRHQGLRYGPDGWVPSLWPGAEKSPAIKLLGESSTAPFLVVRVNGQPIVCKGGNWGLDDALKRVDRTRLEPFIRLEREAGFTMIRNWCGQNTEESFFELCDEYGLMVWNDFWISTQNWNLEPKDSKLWLDNAGDVIQRFRNHPSIVLWCGRNEGVPPPVLNEGLDELVRDLDGSRWYQPSSINLNLLESGPWSYQDPEDYFTRRGQGFTTELGLPSVPTADTLRAMMAPEDLWPISDVWAYHDWHQKDNGRVKPFLEAMERQLGTAASLDDFCRKAQMLQYVSHRALFEGLNANLWKPASGRLLWMSHPAWPSTQWQIYSHDGETSGAYFGSRKACEPIHVQYNLHDHKVVVANTTLKTIEDARVLAQLFDAHGKLLGEQAIEVKVPANATTSALMLDQKPVAEQSLCFLKLSLRGKNGQLLSDNFYWLTAKEKRLRALNALEKADLSGLAVLTKKRRSAHVEVEVKNTSRTVALLLKPTLRNDQGERVLPAYDSDGCFSLLPGEVRTFTIETPRSSGKLHVTFEGWNNNPLTLAVGKGKDHVRK